MEYVEIIETIFKSKQKLPWADVERYLHKYNGMEIVNEK